jgi:predicted GNAT family acetyltransferase
MESNVTVSAAPERNRYEIRLDDELVGVADYVDRDGERLFTHTEVLRTVGNRGLGERLVRFALEDTEQAGKAIVPMCSFVRHVAGGDPGGSCTLSSSLRA